MQNIRAWAIQNPDKVDTLLNQNPSFVFFKPREADNADEGPIGAQGLPLTPKASVAVDRKYIPLGTPLLVSVSQSSPALEFVRPVVAQDTAAPSRALFGLITSGALEMKPAAKRGGKRAPSALGFFFLKV